MSLKKAGRPFKEEKRECGIRVRLTENDRKKLKEMAKYYGKSQSELIRDLLEKHHKDYIKDSFFSTFKFDE